MITPTLSFHCMLWCHDVQTCRSVPIEPPPAKGVNRMSYLVAFRPRFAACRWRYLLLGLERPSNSVLATDK